MKEAPINPPKNDQLVRMPEYLCEIKIPFPGKEGGRIGNKKLLESHG